MKKRIMKILGVGVSLALLTSLMVALPTIANISKPTVDVDDEDISVDTTYTFIFSITKNLADGETITIEFPDDFDISGISNAADGDVRIAATSGIGTASFSLTNQVSAVDEQELTITVNAPNPENAIGVGATLQVDVGDGTPGAVTNIDEPGDYTVRIQTSEEDTYVTSETFTIEEPDVETPPGTVSVYNPNGILIANDSGDDAIQDMLDKVTNDNGWTIKVGPGRYDGNIWDWNFEDVTVVSIDGSDVTEIRGDIQIDQADCVLEGFTLKSDGGVMVDVIDEDVTIKDCAFIKIEDGAQWGIDVDDTDVTIEDCSFDFTDEEDDDVCINVDASDAVIKNCTFNLDEADTGVWTDSGTADDPTMVTDCTFTGTSGRGFLSGGGVSEVEDSTFDSLDTALIIDWGTVTISGCTIMNCGEEAPVIWIDDTDECIIRNNTFTDNTFGEADENLLLVEDDAENIIFSFNTITGTTPGDDDDVIINNQDDGVDLYAANNWWGSAAGPGEDAFSDDVVYEPFLPAAPGDALIERFGGIGDDVEFDAIDEVGVWLGDPDVDAGDEPEWIAAAVYESNPGGAPPTGTVLGFFDVYVTNNPGDTFNDLEIRFYGGVTDDTEVYTWGSYESDWLEVPAQYNEFKGYIEINITAGTTPSIDDLVELPFLLIDPPVEIPEPALETPEHGDSDVDTKPMFAWGSVDDAIRYHFALAEEMGRDDPFDIPDYAVSTTATGLRSPYELKYDTVYHWRVRAETDEGFGDWASDIFTTEKEPAPEPEPQPPVEIIQKEVPAPQITLEVPPSPAPVQVIPDYLLWVIIGVGAVLVIAVVILIVRTRRVV
jgi:hypothetical protein